MLRKLIICFLGAFIFAILAGCSSSEFYNATEIEITTTIVHQIEITTTQTTTVNVDDVQLSFPDEYIVERGDDLGLGFERQFKEGFYRLSSPFINLASREEMGEFTRGFPGGYELNEPLTFSLIKHFDVSFADFYQAAQAEYLHFQTLGYEMVHESVMLPNPYLLFTFNLERINDFYSLDPARHRSARMWLEEWLQTNEPYASYSAFRAANPQ
ncbi:MAG: hypothetical protein FWD06_03360 [Oscillospiraceae bacterium]|nr:hypothetical protein [Oscillospiraceae bacterium]